MRIMFIEPPPTPEWKENDTIRIGGRRHTSATITGEMSYNYWNLSAVAVLREEGYDPKYVHCQSEGIDMRSLKKMIDAYSPDIVVQCIEHVQMDSHTEVTDYCRMAGAVNVWVGPFITGIGRNVFSMGHPHVICLREYDYTIRDIAECLDKKKSLKGVSGIIYRHGNNTIKTNERELIKNLDELPIPAYDCVNLSKFIESCFIRLPTASMTTSRGCPYQCNYCLFPNTIYSHQWRKMSPDRVLNEMTYLRNRGIREIRLDDDTYEIDRKRAIDIANLIMKEKLDITYQPECRPDLMDDELCKVMAKSGCVKILFGVESADDDILKKIRKGMTSQQIYDGCMTARKHGIMLHNCYMLTYWDTKETFQKTVEFAKKMRAEFTQFSTCLPLPGTPYFDMMKRNGSISGGFCGGNSFGNPEVDFPNFTGDELERITKEAYSEYYRDWRYRLMMLGGSLKSVDRLKHFKRMIEAYNARKKAGWL